MAVRLDQRGRDDRADAEECTVGQRGDNARGEQEPIARRERTGEVANGEDDHQRHDAHLLEQREIVLDVPVVRYLAIGHFQKISRDELDCLARPLGGGKRPGEMTTEHHVDGDVVAGEYHLVDLDRKVRNGGAERLRRECRAFESLRTAIGQRMVGEGRRDRSLEIRLVSRVPERVEMPGRRLRRRLGM